MKTYEIGDWSGIDSLRIVERPDPVPGAGQVLMRVRATSLNFRDLGMIKAGRERGVKLPLVPLSDGAGEVEAVGEGVTRFKRGDRVAATFDQGWIAGHPPLFNVMSRALGGGIDGMLSQYVVLAEEGLVHLPAHLSFEEAATLVCAGLTSWHAIVLGTQVNAGESVLVMGTGGVSIFALQFARMQGARVIATSSSDRKLTRLRELGATDVINYKSTPNWDAKVLEATGGAGVDVAVEVGGGDSLAKTIASVRVNGRIALVGRVAGGGAVDLGPVTPRNISLLGIYTGSREMFEDMNRAVVVSGMRPVIDRVFPFEQAREAYRYLESGAHFGKVCISV